MILTTTACDCLFSLYSLIALSSHAILAPGKFPTCTFIPVLTRHSHYLLRPCTGNIIESDPALPRLV